MDFNRTITATAAWPSLRDGTRVILTGNSEALERVKARVTAMTVDELQDVCTDMHGTDLSDYATWHDSNPSDPEAAAALKRLEDEDDEADWEIVGASALRHAIMKALAALAEDDDVSWSFDGLRWWVTGTKPAWSETEETYDRVRLLAAADLFSEPLDGDEYDDVPAMAAAMAILDELAGRVRGVVESADLPVSVRDAALEALEMKRCDVMGAARTLRSVLNRLTDEQKSRSRR